MEQTRYNVLEQVVENLLDEQEDKKFLNDFLVFDNDSQHEGTLELIKEFPKVVQADKNVGLWSAIHWTLHNYKDIFEKDYEFLYVIESDCIHFALDKLWQAEKLLRENDGNESHQGIGSVRGQEFVMAEKDLYNKGAPRGNSRRYAWVTFKNPTTKKKVSFEEIEGYKGIYRCNFGAHIPSLHRIKTMTKVFDVLATRDKGFKEEHFCHEYYKHYKNNAIIDGGLFHSKLGSPNSGTVTASFTRNKDLLSSGYRTTRESHIDPFGTYNVSTIKSEQYEDE